MLGLNMNTIHLQQEHLINMHTYWSKTDQEMSYIPMSLNLTKPNLSIIHHHTSSYIHKTKIKHSSLLHPMKSTFA